MRIELTPRQAHVLLASIVWRQEDYRILLLDEEKDGYSAQMRRDIATLERIRRKLAKGAKSATPGQREGGDDV